ncbi:MAG: hypothetical protein ABJB11_10720 [Ferruginibacter sp.]
MKKTLAKSLIVATLLLGIGITSAKAQSAMDKPPRYKDMVTENKDAEADIKLVTDFINALVANDLDKAKSVLAGNYMGYGPGPADSANAEQVIASWKENNSRNDNRKVGFLSETFNVTSGEQAGHWVSTWGNYSFTQNGKEVKFPYQYTAHVKDGKITADFVYYDNLYILKTLGYTITPPAN